MRAFVLSLCLVIFLSAFPVTAFAEGVPMIELEGEISPRGKYMTLSVSVQNAKGLSAFMLSLEYGSSLVFKGSRSEIGVLEVNSSDRGRLTLVFFLEEGLPSQSEQKLFTVSFSAQESEAEISHIKAFDAVDFQGKDMTLDVDCDFAFKGQMNEQHQLQVLPREGGKALNIKEDNQLCIKGVGVQKDIFVAFVLSGFIVFIMLLWLFMPFAFKREKPFKHLIFEKNKNSQGEIEEENNEEN